jgi:hypothetical protein
MVFFNNGITCPFDVFKKICSVSYKAKFFFNSHLRELERKGIILAYKVHLNPPAMKRIFCKLMISTANINNERLVEFIDYASSLNGAVWPQKVLGNWDENGVSDVNVLENSSKIPRGQPRF